ncbi:MAG TPA: lysophospholipid acyltransferase family protein [Gemmatimonadota bacterium]|nr:lysophospholipid acyltransferase family protein [Gemmatimonadota bacterium]
MNRRLDRFAWKVYAVVRSAGCWVLLTIFTLIVGLSHIPSSLVSPEGRVPRWLEMAYMWAILGASNVELTADGLEHVQPGRSYIVMANHRSMYDIPVLHYLLGRGRDLRWIAKQELLRVPVFGWAYRVSRHVAIDRENRAAAIEALKRAAEDSRAGVSFVIMPEGTRSATGELLPFKRGGFHLALDTRLPILPVAILGSDALMRKGSWYILPGAIHVSVRPVVETRDLGREHIDELLERVRSAISAGLAESTHRSERRVS